MKSNTLKIGLGVLIFLFALALAYYSAQYMNQTSSGYGGGLSSSYWFILFGFAIGYIIVGISVASVLPISLGFLFSADVLLLHTLVFKYSAIPEIYKLMLIGLLMVGVYYFAWTKMVDRQTAAPLDTTTPPAPPVPDQGMPTTRISQ